MEIVSRTRSVDALSGLLILWMIIYHAFQRVGMEHTIAFAVLLKVFFFFMPWFYFKSGLFFKPVGVVNRFASDARKLLKPVIVWGGVGYIVSIALMDLGNVDLIHVLLWPFYFFLAMGDVRGNEPLWFLISLFFVRTLGEIVARLNFSLQAFLLVALVLFGWYLSDIGMMLPIGFQTLFIGLSFYMVASWFQMLKQFEGLRSYRHAVLCIALFIFILACFVAPSYLDVHRNDLWYGDYFAFYLFSLSGIYTFLKLFELCRFRILEWIGKKAIYFLVLHWPVFSIASYAWGLMPHSFGDLGQLFYLIVVAVSVSIICAKYISENKMGLS